MKSHFFTFFICLFLFSCKNESTHPFSDWITVTKNIQYKENQKEFLLKSGNHQYSFAKSHLPFKKIVLLNASLVGYVTELGEENKIVGVSSPEYIYSEKIQKRIKYQQIQNVGNEQKYDVEKIIALKPDAVFTNYIGSFQNTYDLLEKMGIKVIFIDEYLEEKPFEKSAIIEIFGKLLGKEKEASLALKEIEDNYNKYKKIAGEYRQKPRVLTNELYGNQWFLAGGKSQLAYFIKDANAEYIFGNNSEVSALPKSFEEVYAKARNADFWVNIGNHKSKQELLALQPAYAQLNVFQKGEMYALTGKEKAQSNDYFESGVVRADRVLKDYIIIFHPEAFPREKLYYMSKLK